jgi:nicotinate-nucleotide adenylyltransferase
MPRIGIIGGSYNPPHIAHLIIADRFSEQMRLDATYFVPAYRSPFKLGDDSVDTTTSEQRLDMLRLATEHHPSFEVETFETDRHDVSYTIETVRYFHRTKFADRDDVELFLLVGGDQAAAFTKWKHWQEILTLVQLCIARRPHTISPEVERAIAFHLSTDGKLPVWIEAPILAISSTEIRNRVAHNQSIRFLVPHTVEQYILDNGLYK